MQGAEQGGSILRLFLPAGIKQKVRGQLRYTWPERYSSVKDLSSRLFCFMGVWPSSAQIRSFKPQVLRMIAKADAVNPGGAVLMWNFMASSRCFKFHRWSVRILCSGSLATSKSSTHFDMVDWEEALNFFLSFLLLVFPAGLNWWKRVRNSQQLVCCDLEFRLGTAPGCPHPNKESWD